MHRGIIVGLLCAAAIPSGAAAQSCAVGTAPSTAVATMAGTTAAAPRAIIRLYLSATRALVMLRVGDHPPVPVVFDTGTNGNVLDVALAARLGLPNTGPSPSIDGSTGKPVPGHDTFLAHARLGGLAIPDARASAFAYDEPDEVGIFGPNSFPHCLLQMDGPGSRLIVQPKTAATIPTGPALPYLGAGGSALPSAVLDFGDVQIPAILDTGNDGPIILPLAFKDRLPLEAAPVQRGFAVSAAGRQPIYRARLRGSVHLADVTLDRPELYFMEGGRPNVGLPILRTLSVVYDPTEARAWILPRTPPGPR